MKKVLILCTGNSCRSIIAEALVNKYLSDDGIKAYSAGSNPSGKVNPNAKKVLEVDGSWDDSYYSKTIDEVMSNGPFDLVVTVCDNAKESCPVFPNAKVLHVGFEDPDGKPFEAFEETKKLIQDRLLPTIKKELKVINKKVNATQTGVKISFTGEVKKENIVKMVENCATGQCECMSDATKKKIQNMEVKGEDGAVELELTGEIEKEEIEAALQRSKVLNQ